MALKKKVPVLLFFYSRDLTQEQAVAITEAFKDYDVYFRKVVNNSRDLIEAFDAVAGDVPATYIAAAQTVGAQVFEYEVNTSTSGTSEVVAQGGTADLSGSQGAPTQEPSAPAPDAAIKPTDAAKAPTAPTAPPPPPTSTTSKP